MTALLAPLSRPRGRPIEPMGMKAAPPPGCAIHSTPTRTAEQCAACAKAHGCAACFEQLVRMFQTPLLHFLMRRFRSRHDAEEVLQETFLTAHRKLGSYRSSSRFGAWLFTIAHRLAVSRKRRRKWFRSGGDDGLGAQIATDDPQTNAQDNERRSRLWDEVARILDEDAFTAIWLHYVESMSTAEIGQILQRNPSGVRMLLYRARTQLTHQISPDWRPGGE